MKKKENNLPCLSSRIIHHVPFSLVPCYPPRSFNGKMVVLDGFGYREKRKLNRQSCNDN